jgi:hypothetical protein
MITTLLQTTTVMLQTPEHMLVLWDNVLQAVQMAGLTEAKVQAAVGMVIGEATVSLCITQDSDLDRWAQHLSMRYLANDKGTLLMHQLHDLK